MSNVLVTRDAGVATVMLNRPDSLNALSSELMDELPAVLREVAEDPQVGCVVLTGAGRGFCAGGDLKSRQAELDAQALLPEAERIAISAPYQIEALLRSRVESARLLHDMPKPTIAMVNGACAGAGLSLAGACDLRFAAASAVFTSAFTRAGLSGDFGGSWFWTRILGTAKARELYLMPRRLSAAEALDWGMLTAVLDDEQLQAHTMDLARSLAGGRVGPTPMPRKTSIWPKRGRCPSCFRPKPPTWGWPRAPRASMGSSPPRCCARTRTAVD